MQELNHWLRAVLLATTTTPKIHIFKEKIVHIGDVDRG